MEKRSRNEGESQPDSPVLSSLSVYNEESWPLRLSKVRRERRSKMANDRTRYVLMGGGERMVSTSGNFLHFYSFPFPSFGITVCSFQLSAHFAALLQLRSLDLAKYSIRVPRCCIKKLSCYSFCSHTIQRPRLFNRNCDS